MSEKIHDIFLFIFTFICKKVKKCQASFTHTALVVIFIYFIALILTY